MAEMDYQKLVYVVILVVNVAFILGAIYTLWKLSEATENSTADIRKAANMTQDSLRAFREWVEAFKLAAKESGQRQESLDESANAQRMMAELQRLSTSIEELDASRLNQMLTELDTVIKHLPEVQAADSMDAAARARLEAHRERLKAEVEQLQKRLNESSQVIADLRRENRSAFTSGSALDTLKSVNERLFAEIRTMRTRMLSAEEKAALQSAEIQRLRSGKPGADNAGSREAGPHAEISALQKQLQTLETDRAGLLEQLQETEESMSRMVREKAMIEERYLELDSAQR
jgi:chromosome segregation ATPase